MRRVTINVNQLGLHLEPSADTGVTRREVGEIRPAAGVESGGGAELRHPVGDVLHPGANVGPNHEPLRMKARGGEVIGEGKSIELRLEIEETGFGGGEIREAEVGGLFQVLSERHREEAEESRATWGVGVLAGAAQRDEVVTVGRVPWDPENVVEVHRTRGDAGGLRENGDGGERKKRENCQQSQNPATLSAVVHGS